MMVEVALGVLGVAVLYLVYLNWRLQVRFKRALGGSGTGNLEKKLTDYFGRIGDIEKRQDIASQTLSELSLQTDLASQKISIVRFNPFGDSGGDQSFSLAVLDAKDSGYVLTSIHGRENSHIYIKPIDLGVSKYTLSKEEKQATLQAAKRVVPKAKAKERHG